MTKIRNDIFLKDLTTLQIGGQAKYFAEVQNEDELIEALKFAQNKSITFFVFGGGSNLLISDSGFDGLAIKFSQKGISLTNETTLAVKTGTVLQEFVDFSISQNLSGLQKLTGIPGTVGGAIYGNAGAYGQTVSDHLIKVICLNPVSLKKIELAKNECQFSYRDSGFKTNKLVILEAVFGLNKTNNDLQKESDEILEKRLKKYKPGILCPGSFFKNVLMEELSNEQKKLIPPDRDYFGKVPAWFFLDEVGAKGDRLGNIQIADFHGNLFINLGGGTAEDFYNLAKKYYFKVKEKFGISLEPEVQFVNLVPFENR
jgi:UDP-N-acetylmuramate dehydrogenase